MHNEDVGKKDLFIQWDRLVEDIESSRKGCTKINYKHLRNFKFQIWSSYGYSRGGQSSLIG